jgi:signal transduction histidine kinase
LLITIQDNGVGMVEKRSAPESSGQGLALHSTMMAVIGGALTVISDPGLSTRILLTLPASSIENLIQEPGA